MLTENFVHIWQIDVDPPPSHSDMLQSMSTGDDPCRAGQISDPTARSRFEVERAAAHLILGWSSMPRIRPVALRGLAGEQLLFFGEQRGQICLDPVDTDGCRNPRPG